MTAAGASVGAASGAIARTYLFVPGTRPERIPKALASGAHAVIVDLEDAVPPADKARARDAIAGALDAARPVLVRINAAGTPWFDDDVRLCRHAGVAGVVLPKTEDATGIARVRAGVAVRAFPVFPLVETALGLWNAPAIARAPGVARLLFGSIDYQLDLGLADDELLHARSQLVLVSRVAELPAPVDGVTTAIDDVEAIRRDTNRARALGFGGKLCIHPAQVEFVNAAFRPTTDEVAWATRVVAADAAAGGAAVAVDGRMVDRPVLLKAREILAGAARG
jgi:citrate lyase subunit beta/citryl-CoA lyase